MEGQFRTFLWDKIGHLEKYERNFVLAGGYFVCTRSGLLTLV